MAKAEPLRLEYRTPAELADNPATSPWVPIEPGMVICPRDRFRDAAGRAVPADITRWLYPGPVKSQEIADSLKGWTILRYQN